MNTESPNGRFDADDSVDRAWRRASVEEPSPPIDAAIIAAARAEAARARQATRPATAARAHRNGAWWLRWQPLAAAAAVAGLAFVLVQTIPRDRDVATPISPERARPQAPTARPAEPKEAPSIAEPEVESDQVGAAAGGQARESSADRAEAFEGRVSSNAKAAPASAEARAAEPALAADQWAAKVEALAAAGDFDAAARELRAFRLAYGRAEADRLLPETLRAWASSVE